MGRESFTNSDTIYDLNGVGFAVSGSVNVFGGSVGAEYVGGSARDGNYVDGKGVSPGFGSLCEAVSCYSGRATDPDLPEALPRFHRSFPGR